jgi:hypothetical protein
VTRAERVDAARLLGVPVEATSDQVDAAYRELVRERHPDLFPEGSPDRESATRAMQELNAARRTLVARDTAFASADADAADRSSTMVPDGPAVAPWSRATVGASDAAQALRSARLRGLCWGVFLLVAAVVSWLVGAGGRTNDAVPLWSPALAAIGVLSLILSWRAHVRLRRLRG